MSLTYEPGRAAFAGRGATFQELRRDRRRARRAARAGQALRRARSSPTSSAGCSRRTSSERRRARGAVALLEGGGERAELELVAAHVRAAAARGHAGRGDRRRPARPRRPRAPGVRRRGRAGRARRGRRRRAHRASAAGVAALLRCALRDGSADDLIAWLRTPGKLRRPELADRLEQDVRVAGESTATAARARWEAAHPDFPLAELDRVAAARARARAPRTSTSQREVDRLALAPWRGRARVLAGSEALDARVARALARGVRRARRAGARRPLAGARRPRADRARRGPRGAPGARRAPAPSRSRARGAVRARRVRALFVCGLTEGSFPRPGRPEPFLGDAERRAHQRGRRAAPAPARGRPRRRALPVLRGRVAADRAARPQLGARATTRGARSCARCSSTTCSTTSRTSRPTAGAWGPRASTRRSRRPSAPRERARAAEPTAGARAARGAAARRRGARRACAAREAWSASALEAYASCPVKWFVERLLRPDVLEPDPEPMLRGELAHRILEDAFRELADGGGRLTPDRLDEARAILHAALERHSAGARLSANPERLRSALRRLEADLLRYVDHAAHAGSDAVPAHFELHVRRRRGRAPRRRARRRRAAAHRPHRPHRRHRPTARRSSTTTRARPRPSAPTGSRRRALQVGLYMLALPQVLGVEAAGGLYQPLGSEDGAPARGDPRRRRPRPAHLQARPRLRGGARRAARRRARRRARRARGHPRRARSRRGRSAARGTAAARTRRSAAARRASA